MPHRLHDLLERNRAWAEKTAAERPGFFTDLLAQQTPQHLWIGCADSRVPANQILGLPPGEVFVHRNVANVLVHSDLNALSVMQYAVDALKVKHIMVVGHYGCGGVTAALRNQRIGIVDNWLRHVQDVRDKHRAWLRSLPSEGAQLQALCALNVLEQTLNVCGTTVVQDAWARGQDLVVHGWVYGLHNGVLEDLQLTARDAADVEPAYELALQGIQQRFALQAPPPTQPN